MAQNMYYGKSRLETLGAAHQELESFEAIIGREGGGGRREPGPFT